MGWGPRLVTPEAMTYDVDGAAVYVAFDPAVVQVTSVIAGDKLPLGLQQEVDNTGGRLALAAGTLETPPTGRFLLAQVELVAVGQGVSPLAFQHDSQHESDITFGGSSILATAADSAVTVASGGGDDIMPAQSLYLPIVAGQ